MRSRASTESRTISAGSADNTSAALVPSMKVRRPILITSLMACSHPEFRPRAMVRAGLCREAQMQPDIAQLRIACALRRITPAHGLADLQAPLARWANVIERRARCE